MASPFLYQICCYNIVVWNRFTSVAFPKSKEHYSNNVSVRICQIFKQLNIAVFLWVKWVLFAHAWLNCFFQLPFKAWHFRMIKRFNNMLPAFLGQINVIAIMVANRPTYTHIHNLALTANYPKIIRQFIMNNSNCQTGDSFRVTGDKPWGQS